MLDKYSKYFKNYGRSLQKRIKRKITLLLRKYLWRKIVLTVLPHVFLQKIKELNKIISKCNPNIKQSVPHNFYFISISFHFMFNESWQSQLYFKTFIESLLEDERVNISAEFVIFRQYFNLFIGFFTRN